MNAETYELPEGWTWARFHDVAEVVTDLVDPADYSTSPHIAPNHIESFTGRLLPYCTIASDGVRSPKHRFRPGQILYSKIRPYLCKAVLVDFNGLCSADMYPVSAKIYTAYLHRWLISPRFTEWTSNHDGRTVLPKINQEALSAIPVPVPPFAEQQRIVAKVETLLAHVNAAREQLARGQAILKRFRQSVLAAACSGRLTADWREIQTHLEPAAKLLEELVTTHNEAGQGHGGKAADPSEEAHTLTCDELPSLWVVAELKWLCEPGRPITYGILKPGHHQSDGVPYVRVADFPNDLLNLATIRKTTRQIADQYRRSSLLMGDLLLSIRGTVGRTCRVPKDLEGANITQDTARITVARKVLADYVQLCLRSPSAQDRMKRAVKGVAVRGINIGDVRVLQVPLPPVIEQHEIVRRVQALFRLADAIEKRVAAATARAERLTQAILAKAFRGELVPTEAELARAEGRDYEPASVLLERIHIGRGLAPESLTGNGRRPRRSPRPDSSKGPPAPRRSRRPDSCS
jgi:type I restriction enzyme S subunit